MRTRWLLASTCLCWSTFLLPVQAQVRQSGNVTPTHFACFTTTGVIQDCGANTNPYATTGGVIGPFCVLSAAPTSAGYQSFCLQANSAGGILSAQSFGTAPTPGISFLINGSPSAIPLVTGATVSGDLAAFNNTSGGLIDSGIAQSQIGLLSGNNTWTGDQYFGSGRPWVDVRSGANSCAKAKGDGSTNDRAAIQCQIDYLHNTFNAGEVFFPIGQYVVLSSLNVPTHIVLRGVVAAANGSFITTNGTDITAISFASSIGVGGDNSGLVDLQINCNVTSGATQNCVFVGDNALVNADRVVIQGGLYGLENKGVDGVWSNVNICGYGTHGGCFLQEAGNWFIHAKFDSGTVVDYAINVSTPASAAASESYCIACDTSGPFALGAIRLNNAGSVPFFGFIGGVVGPGISVSSNSNLMISSAEIATTSVVNNGTLTVGSSIPTAGSITVSGSGSTYCASTPNITASGSNCNPPAAARTQSTPANKSITASSATQMLGLAGTITPTLTGKVLIMLRSETQASTSGDCTYQLRYGTGSAPANGDASTGSNAGNNAQPTSGTGTFGSTMIGYVTGLTLNTAYWLDMAATTSASTITCSSFNNTLIAIEE